MHITLALPRSASSQPGRRWLACASAVNPAAGLVAAVVFRVGKFYGERPPFLSLGGLPDPVCDTPARHPIRSTRLSLSFNTPDVILAILSERWPRLKRWDAAGMVMLVILVGLWLLTLTLNTALTGVLILLLPALLVLGLYWMRWRFIHPMPAGLRPPP